MRTAFFWVITQRVVVIPYRTFGTTYRSYRGDRVIESENIGRDKSKSHFRKFQNSSFLRRSFLQKVQMALRQIMPVMGLDGRSQRPRGLRRRCMRPLTSGIAGPNPTVGMDVCLFWVLCVVRWTSLRRADHSSRVSYPVWCVQLVWPRSPVGEALTRNQVEAAQEKKMYFDSFL